MVLQPDLNGFTTRLNSFAMRESNGLAMWIKWFWATTIQSSKFKVQSLDESECQAQHNSSYAVGYNGYVQTDLAQSNTVYLFYVLTIAPLFSLMVASEPDILTHLSFELCILVAQNHSICVARPFDSHYKTIRTIQIVHRKIIRTVLPNHLNRAAKPFESCIAKPFKPCCQTIRTVLPNHSNRAAKPFEPCCQTIQIVHRKTIQIVHRKNIPTVLPNHSNHASQNHSNCASQNHSNRATKPFKSCIAKPFESNRVAKPFDA